MKVCLQPGCPAIQRETRCPAHRRAREQERGSRQARGYDADYDRERRRYVRLILAGEVIRCWRCGQTVDLDFDLGHCDNDRAVIHGPEHSGANRGARGPCVHPMHHAPATATHPPGMSDSRPPTRPPAGEE